MSISENNVPPTEGIVKIRRTAWNKFLTGREQGFDLSQPADDGVDDSSARGFHFIYDDFEESHFLMNYYWATDDYYDEDSWESKEEYEKECLRTVEVRRLIARIEEDNKTSFYDGHQPWVAIKPADLERLRELASEMDLAWNCELSNYLRDPTQEETVIISVNDYDTLMNLSQLLTRDMPGDEPNCLNYNFITQRY